MALLRLFNTASDGDIAVRGLPPERYLEAWDFLERELGVPADFIRQEEAPTLLETPVSERESCFLTERELEVLKERTDHPPPSNSQLSPVLPTLRLTSSSERRKYTGRP